MINETENTSEANVPFDEAKESGPKGKIKDYGKKSLAPLLELAHKYRADITPFFAAITKGLEGGSSALLADNSSEVERQVGEWFRQASSFVEETRGKFEGNNASDLISFVERQASTHPGLMFSSSYFVGMFLGRLGRHIIRGTRESMPGKDISNTAVPEWNDQQPTVQ